MEYLRRGYNASQDKARQGKARQGNKAPAIGSMAEGRENRVKKEAMIEALYSKLNTQFDDIISKEIIDEDLYKEIDINMKTLTELNDIYRKKNEDEINALVDKFMKVSKIKSGILFNEDEVLDQIPKLCEVPKEDAKYLEYISKGIEKFKDIFTSLKEVIDSVTDSTEKIAVNLFSEQSGSYGFIINNSSTSMVKNKEFFNFLKTVDKSNIKLLKTNDAKSQLIDYNYDLNDYIISEKTCLKIAHPYKNTTIANKEINKTFINESESILLLKDKIESVKWEELSSYINIVPPTEFNCTFRLYIPDTHRLIYTDETYQTYKNIKYLDIIVMKYCSDGDLFQMLYRTNKIKIPNPIKVFNDVSEVIRILHSKVYAHCDIKLNNIIHCDDKYKLIDYGSMMQNSQYYSEKHYIIGTKYYTLPLFDDQFKSERLQKYTQYENQSLEKNPQVLQQKALAALAPSYFNKKSGLQSEFYCYSKFILNCQSKFKKDYNTISNDIKSSDYNAQYDNIRNIGQHLVYKSDEYALAIVLRNIYDVILYYKTIYGGTSLLDDFIKRNIIDGNEITDIEKILSHTEKIIDKLLEIERLFYQDKYNDFMKTLGSLSEGGGLYKYKSRKYKIYTHNGKKSIKTKNGYVTIKEIEKAQFAKYNNMTTEELKKRVFKNKYATEYMQTHKNNKKSYLTALKYADSLK